jgi:hypothetical protein
MTTTIVVQITPQGILIPRTALQGWTDIELVQTEQHIVLRPKASSLALERELAIQALREDGLLYEPEKKPELPIISDTERASLAEKLSIGRPLSEIIIEERDDRA